MSQQLTSEPRARVITGESKSKASRSLQASPDLAWTMLGRFGLLAVLVGLFDIALAWYPFAGGNPAWEFGIFNLTIWSLPFPTTGLVALLASGAALGSRRRIGIVAVCLLALAAVVLIVTLMYAMVIPIALRGAPDATQLNVKKSIAKTVVLGIAFPALYITLAVSALRYVKKAGRK